jgi:hypothetical protein
MSLRINQRKLLIVEGSHEASFFQAALPHCALTDIQVLPIGGKDRLRVNLSALTRDAAFPEVSAIAVVRDADDSANAAFQSVRDALEHVSLAAPTQHAGVSTVGRRVGIFIFPDGMDRGSLESLCAQSVSTQPEFKCVDAYLECLASHDVIVRQPHKSRTRVWLASRADPDWHIGTAAAAGEWPWAAPVFQPLWNFLSQMYV